ncbi:cytidylyltransferase domain-containing protein [Hymenobacter properus]|uniref:Glycosyltransferase family protein n=1 Tax=Hymenobacter properus TaxID=2791026 RepID=A0A931BHB8_9BACT|nr:glycosyltransferase family protein [Hymenobacter properus]MBF9143945.1 glycosyltransferase family protein [Hymenobacter properus]MBR7722760.1 glycosyltransferase family protein [Microvirga sp. SRT04]
MTSSWPVRVVVVIQARMNSSRLPGKVLLPLPLSSETTVLGHVVARAKRVVPSPQVVVATSTLAADDAVAAAALALNVGVFRGDEQDVLARFVGAAAAHQAEVVVRITSDNPALDPAFMRAAVTHHLATQADYTLTTGLPLGTNVEVITTTALRQAAAEATRPEEREHVTPYLRRHPELFRLQTLPLTVPPAVADLRLTVDYPSDYALLHLLFSELPADFSLTDPAGLPALLARHPWLAAINNANAQVQP